MDAGCSGTQAHAMALQRMDADNARLTKMILESVRKSNWDDAACLVRMFDKNQTTQCT